MTHHIAMNSATRQRHSRFGGPHLDHMRIRAALFDLLLRIAREDRLDECAFAHLFNISQPRPTTSCTAASTSSTARPSSTCSHASASASSYTSPPACPTSGGIFPSGEASLVALHPSNDALPPFAAPRLPPRRSTRGPANLDSAARP